MSTFTPSKYQKVIKIYQQKGKGNAVIDAVAGSGKSTTIVNLVKDIPANKSVLFLAFNKAIVEELKIKIGNQPNIEVKTLHSLGATAIMRAFHPQIQEDKYRAWVNNGFKCGMIRPTVILNREEESEYKQNIVKLIDLGRVNLVQNRTQLEDLAIKHNLDLYNGECGYALEGIAWGESQTDTIDFTDMIYFPNVKRIKMPLYDWVLIDECQDLNAAQREMFLKCVKPNGRFIAVGDPRQAIYGFAGADVESFNILKSLPNTVKLPLSVCYRCDEEIIKLAKAIVPQIECKPGAGKGMVNYQAKVAEVVDGDMILCRVTSPLVQLCMRYIANGVRAYVKGKDIGVNLINMIKKTKQTQIADAEIKLRRELSRIIGKVVSKSGCTEAEAKESDLYRAYEDKLHVIEVLAEGLVTCQEVIDRIEAIFKDDNKSGICLSTIHKSKGLESDRVFVLCPDKLYLKSCMKVAWMAEQERNLEYVMITRAKHYLGYIDDFESKH